MITQGGFMSATTSGPKRRRSERETAAHCENILSSPGWSKALSQFANATGLTVCLYDTEGQLYAGPFATAPVGETLVRTGGWKKRGFCLPVDVETVLTCVKENAIIQCRGLDLLALFAVPVRLDGSAIAGIVAGWVFDNFPDPISTDRLAKLIGLPYNELWQIVRQQPPVSHEKLRVYGDLLQTLSDSFVLERAETLREREQSRVLLTLNESARRLAAAASMDEIGAAVVDATVALTHADGARLLVAAEDGEWHTAGRTGVGPDFGSKPERRALTSSLRVLVEASDSTLLAMIQMNVGKEFVERKCRTQLSALAAQTAIALQKFRLHADLEQKQLSLERANRTKDEFLATLSHELRTPLTPILGWATMMRQGRLQQDSVMLNSAVEAIERNARQELHLVGELLDLSRILNQKIHLEPELINPTDALASAFANAQTMAAARELRFELDVSQDLPFISVDTKRLQQVLANLVSNSIKFTADGGLITLGARAEGKNVEMFVTDTGIGIPPDALNHIFDRFQQGDSSTTRRFGGLGIGLSVVRGLVELHGGHVYAQSQGEGQGATFILSFPAVSVSSRRREAHAERMTVDRQGVEQEDGQRSGRILIVDDSADNLFVIKVMIESVGYEVETAGSVVAALEALGRFIPDCIVSDIGMPEADGYELLRRVRENQEFNAIPVIALTGYASSVEREALLGAGFAAHLPKPVESSSLLTVLDGVLTIEKKQS